MKDNTVNTNGIEVYESNIHQLADEYITHELNKPEDISNKQCFAGMIKYISKHIPKVDITDLVLLNNMWSIYTSLCYKYKHIITIERYCMLIDISRETFYRWKREDTRNDYCEELSLSRCDIIKKWDSEAESSMQDEASTGNPGPMFILKARRGWSETQTTVHEHVIRTDRTPEQIAGDYNITLPDKDTT